MFNEVRCRRGKTRAHWHLGTLAISLLLSLVASADDSFYPQSGSAMTGDGKSYNSVLDFLQHRDPNYASIIDGFFMYEARRMPNATSVTAMMLDTSTPAGMTQLGLANNLLAASAAASSRANYFATMAQGANVLDTNGKLALLSSLGSTLSGCYDYAAAASGAIVSQDAVYAALHTGTGTCGVCRDIHTYIADAAKALGFVDAGTHTGIWVQSPTDAGRHEITQMRDPQTGEYYVVNYSAVINTHETTLTQALDISLRVLGPLTGQSFVESTSNDNHVYIPRTARWIQSVLDQNAQFVPGQSLVSFHVGNTQNDVAVNLSQNWGIIAIKTFATVNEVETAEGQFRVMAVGGSLQIKKDFELGNGAEIGFQGQGAGGYLDLNAPTVVGGASQGDGTYERTNFFFMAKIAAHARWNAFTAQIEVMGSSLDYKNINDATAPYVAGTASVTYQPKPWIALSYARKIEVAHNNNTEEIPKPRTAYDKISVILDAKLGKVYLYNKGELYLFEGIENTSAIGVREYFKARLPAGVLGEFSVCVDVSKVIANPSGDPFYQSDLHAVFGVGWSRALIKKYLQIGANLSYDATGSCLILLLRIEDRQLRKWR